MGFAEDIAKVAEKVRKYSDRLLGEEATKKALIEPFIQTLGYDITDPDELLPEFVADFATKVKPLKKVDYAIAINGSIVMLVEAKALNEKPEAHDGQLAYYFNGLGSAKVAIVTNGVEYRFFTDLRAANKMDVDPFFSFNVLKHELKDIENLKLFHRDNFDAAAIGKQAEEMIYVKGMTQLIGNLLRTPSKEFMRFLLKEISNLSPNYAIEGQINDKRIANFEPIIKKSLQNSLVELMTRSISQEMTQSHLGDSVSAPDALPPEPEIQETQEEEEPGAEKIVAALEELEAVDRIKAITNSSSQKQRDIGFKKVTAYVGVHAGKPGWWFLRLYLLSKRKTIVTRLTVDEVQTLAPNFQVEELSVTLGDAKSRIIISDISDLEKLSPLVLKCFETEALKHSA